MRRTHLFAACLSLAWWAAPWQFASATMIFDYAGIPAHSGHYAWTDGVPHFHHHHFHDSVHDTDPNDAIEGHDVAHELSGTRTNEPDYDPYSVWVNENYLVFDGSAGGAATEFFGHGFIIEQPKPTPEYRFEGDAAMTLFDDAGVAFDARPFIRDAFKVWSDLIVDDVEHLIMGLAFREFAGDGDAAEITVRAVDYLAGAVAAWSPSTQTLLFRRYDHPTNRTAADKHRWFIGADQATFLGLGGPHAILHDLPTVALHEVGHIVGLDHQTDIDDIMEDFTGSRAGVNAGGTFRMLSDDDILGARDLYSIPYPVPEPATALMAFSAVCFLGCRRRKTS
jgi:hypothetical protein